MSLQVDTWHATTIGRIATIRAAILDVIDCGVTFDELPDLRPPTEREIIETDRADGIFRSRPVGGSRRSEVSRPTEAPTIAHENASQAVTTALLTLCIEAGETLATFDLDIDDLDIPHRRYEEATYSRPEPRWVIDLHPAACATWTITACGWLETAVGLMAAEWRTSEPDVMPSPYGHAKWLGGKVEGLSKRVRPERPRLCACGCKAPAPQYGQGATRPACRKRKSRSNVA